LRRGLLEGNGGYWSLSAETPHEIWPKLKLAPVLPTTTEFTPKLFCADFRADTETEIWSTLVVLSILKRQKRARKSIFLTL